VDVLLSDFTLFHFIRPWFLLAIAPAFLLFIFLWFRKPNYGSWHQVISPHLLTHLLQGTIKQQGKSPLVLLLIGWMLASIALAGPTWSKLPQTVQKKINAKVILLDLSLSMLAQDIKPSRLIRAQHKLSDILDQSEEGLTGLITYAGTSHVVSPLTDDTHTILSMVSSLSPEIMPFKGSNPVAAVEKAVELLTQAGINEGQILLITDDLPPDFVDKVKQFLNPSLTPVSIYAIGTNEGAPVPLSKGTFIKDSAGAIVVPRLNPRQLKAAAKALKGRFSTLSSDDEDIHYLLKNNNRLLNDEMKDTDRDFDTWNESGLILVVLLLPLAALANRKGWLASLLLPLLLTTLTMAPTSTAEAFSWDDLWTTKDQQAQQAWKNGNLQQATELFESPEWKASAQYKSGDFQSSAETLQQHVTTDSGNTADNQYNLGNALAKQQDFPSALKAYEKALELDPDMLDAKNNHATVKKLLEQQEKEQEKEQEQQEQDKQEGDGDKEDQDKQDQNESNDPSDEKQSEEQQSEKEKSDQQKQEQSKENQSEEQENNDNQNTEQESEKQDQEDETEKDKQDNQAQEETPEEPEQQTSAMDIQESNLNKEDKQALEQWLRRIPDDPGGLLRRKFAQESQLRRNQPVEGKQW